MWKEVVKSRQNNNKRNFCAFFFCFSFLYGTLETLQCHSKVKRKRREHRTEASRTVRVYQSSRQTIAPHQANRLGSDVKFTVQRVER